MSVQEAARPAQPIEFRASGADVARLAPGCVLACRPVRGRLRRARTFAFAAMRALALAAMLAFALFALFVTAALS